MMNRRFHRAYGVAGALMLTTLASVPAQADFLDDVRRTFTTDMPHFFQDDIPCAFGGQPTSHTKTSCKAPDPPAKAPSVKAGNRVTVPPGKTKEVRHAPANLGAGSAGQAAGP